MARALIDFGFLPIVTTQTVLDPESDGRAVVHDAKRLAQAFIDYTERAGFNCLPVKVDSTYPAEMLGCGIGFKGAEPVVTGQPELDSPEQVAALEQVPMADLPRVEAYLEAVEIAAGQGLPVMANSPGVLSTAGRLLGMDKLMLSLGMKPDLTAALLDKVAQACLEFSREAVRRGAKMLFLAEPAASTNLISPKMFREKALPALQRQIKALDVPIIVHICGRVEPILGDLAQTGGDVLSLDQAVDLARARAAVDPAVGIGGNIDPVDALAALSPAEVERLAGECLEQGGDNFVLMPGCTITPATPMENVRAMIRAADRA